MISRQQRNALVAAQRIAEAVIATINETPDGAPGGVLYAALMSYMSLEEFETMMSALVYAERIRAGASFVLIHIRFVVRSDLRSTASMCTSVMEINPDGLRSGSEKKPRLRRGSV